MQLGELEFRRQSHPVDVIELVASDHDWSFERPCDDEIAVSVRGDWTDYSVSFSWMEASEALHLGCAFTLKVPVRRQVEVLRLLSRINEQLVLGHFDLWADEGAVMFRHALLLSGGVQPTNQQAERLLSVALEACERYYQAFQFVVWAEKSVDEAMAYAVFDTVGSA
ncbi:YbjN domain-containing protein [Aureimonas sp. ME7]|uniref:YbjN domain-containing protein n=1 Tax=Aureimonas sp. ME7 TaxID=2744252 RepID=UPI001AEE0E06|nr:YbjN domain-containing protein [Aureimonas sp. ME7]